MEGSQSGGSQQRETPGANTRWPLQGRPHDPPGADAAVVASSTAAPARSSFQDR